jgi:4-hydroxybenzoate polyprenyltransferase/phosphoserine phosphatase
MNILDPTRAGVDLPLVVDVDGTLLKGDLLHETVMQFLATRPLEAPRLIGWLAQGRPTLKRKLAQAADPHVETLPLREAALSVIRSAQAEGRPVYLASASDHVHVKSLAERIGGIAGVFATDSDANLAGEAKAQALVAAFGIRGFDYMGDCAVDFAVWTQARRSLAVCHSGAFERRLKTRLPDAQVVDRVRTRPRDLLRAMRPHQWAKNILLFLPLIGGHLFDAESIGRTLLAFACFCMAASSAYILNDLLDLPADRVHARNQFRPFAAGKVPISTGVLLGAFLFVAAMALSQLLPPTFVALLGLYLLTTVAYSLVLKRKLVVDVITLGALYTIRVMAGLEATRAEQSHWLLMICLFLFTSLATVKRSSELVRARKAGVIRAAGRGYRVDDLPIIASLGAAAGYSASLVLALYISSPEVTKLYTSPWVLWLIEPLFLYWISRMLILSHRGYLKEDPVIFACTDKVSLATGACVALVVAFAL